MEFAIVMLMLTMGMMGLATIALFVYLGVLLSGRGRRFEIHRVKRRR